jgi:hypothetical protein
VWAQRGPQEGQLTSRQSLAKPSGAPGPTRSAFRGGVQPTARPANADNTGRFSTCHVTAIQGGISVTPSVLR